MKKSVIYFISIMTATLVNSANLQAQTKPAARKSVAPAARTTTSPAKKVASSVTYTQRPAATPAPAMAIVQPAATPVSKVSHPQQIPPRVVHAPAAESRFRIGFRAGVNSSKITGMDVSALGSGVQFARVTGFHTGVMFNIGGPSFSIQPEILYSQYGTRLNLGSDYIQLKYSLLEVPLLLKASFGQPNLRFFVNAGPMATYTMNGTASFMESGQSGSQEIDLTGTGRFSFGATGGAGVSMQAGPGAVQLEARYNYLFSTNENGDKLNPQNLMVSVGYLIPLGGR
ncbi:PorT family protein [Spirosoma sp. BT702]|uniref:PorT family protein n=1 Tax=Spirosoma profusum TaxID=2771354 RepID=A0A926XUJ0_9BACT|nr:porin family protein [Spirosoma profusum]MBD2699781.1 PorT family protein [Spirosoma profusum]